MKNLLLAGFVAFMMAANVTARDVSIKVPGGAEHNIKVDGLTLDQIRAVLERRSGMTLRLLAGKDGDYRGVSDYSAAYADQQLVAKKDRARAEAGHFGRTMAEIAAAEAAAAAATRIAIEMPNGNMNFDFDEKDSVGDLRARVWDAYDAARREEVDFVNFGLWVADGSGSYGRVSDDDLVQEYQERGLRVMVSTVDYNEDVELARRNARSDAEFAAYLKMSAAEREKYDALQAARERADGRSTKPTIEEVLEARKAEAAAKAAATASAETELQRRLRLARERAERTA